jgi:limonene-1,2-epoxide hydrolase
MRQPRRASAPAIRRRSFLTTSLATAALGALAPLALASRASAAEWSEAEKANVKLVTDFCASWSTRDLKQVFPRLADTSVYRMTETTPPVIGQAGITERLGSWMESSDRIQFEILDTFALGPIVINHRIDHFVSKTRPLTWEGVGVFFVKDGKIQEWSDYTIRVVR